MSFVCLAIVDCHLSDFVISFVCGRFFIAFVLQTKCEEINSHGGH